MNDELLEELILLEADLACRGIRLILGGGMSLYLRNLYVRPKSDRRYPIQIEGRSTNDLDFYLTSDLIVDRKAAEKVKECLAGMGYVVNPEAKNFQFIKEVKGKAALRTFKVDLLAQPPAKGDESLVEISSPRIKPKGITGFHAYLTEEAAGIDIGILEIDVKSLPLKPSKKAGTIYIPSSYNYLIMKLHAFDDRKERAEVKSDYGRHHALDIFATVARMNEEDWKIARTHFEEHKGRAYMKRAVRIRQACFSEPSAIGLLRLRENEAFRRNRTTFEPYLAQFIADLGDLFPRQFP